MVAHGTAGGEVPDASVAVVLIGLVAWVGSAFAWNRLGMPAVLGVLAAAQLGMHSVMVVMANASFAAGDPLLMVLTHALATVVSAVLLLRADAMFHVVETAVVYLRGLLRLTHLAGVPGPVVVWPRSLDHHRVPLAVELRRVHGRRGPPSCS